MPPSKRRGAVSAITSGRPEKTDVVSPARAPRRARAQVIVTSDMPTITGVLPWERDLLLPIVERLIDDVLAEGPGEGHSSGAHHGEDEEP